MEGKIYTYHGHSECVFLHEIYPGDSPNEAKLGAIRIEMPLSLPDESERQLRSRPLAQH